MDEGKAVGVVYLDFIKAFQTLSVSLITKLVTYRLEKVDGKLPESKSCDQKSPNIDWQPLDVPLGISTVTSAFAGDPDEGTECALGKFVLNTKPGEQSIFWRAGLQFRGTWTRCRSRLTGTT